MFLSFLRVAIAWYFTTYRWYQDCHLQSAALSWYHRNLVAQTVAEKGPFFWRFWGVRRWPHRCSLPEIMVQHQTNHAEDMTDILFNWICKQRNEKNVFVEKRGDLKGIVGTWWSTMNHIRFLGKLSLGKSNSFLFLPPIVVVIFSLTLVTFFHDAFGSLYHLVSSWYEWLDAVRLLLREACSCSFRVLGSWARWCSVPHARTVWKLQVKLWSPESM